MSRELVLRQYIDLVRHKYDYIIIDCMPSLGVMTVNALAAADRVLIPVQAAYLPVRGLQALIKTVYTVKKRLNPVLDIEGILLTMVDNRTNYAKDIVLEVNDVYGKTIPVFPLYENTKENEKVVYTFEKPEEFKVFNEGNGVFRVEGDKIERLFANTNFKDEDSVMRFSRTLSKMKIDDALREKGCKDGDRVYIRDYGFEFIDEND